MMGKVESASERPFSWALEGIDMFEAGGELCCGEPTPPSGRVRCWVRRNIMLPHFPVLDYIITSLIFALSFSAPSIVNIFRILFNISLEHFRFPLKHVFRVNCHISG